MSEYDDFINISKKRSNMFLIDLLSKTNRDPIALEGVVQWVD